MKPSSSTVIQLKERDLDVLHYLGLGHVLTLEQLGALVYPGMSTTHLRTRLLHMSTGTKAGGRGLDLVKRSAYARDEGQHPQVVWLLTERGRRILETRRDVVVPRWDMPVHPRFMRHALTLNELLVRLLVCGPSRPQLTGGQGYPSERAHFIENLKAFEWVSFTEARLPWREVKLGVVKERHLEPDAVLTVPQARVRFFIENELGSHPVDSRDKERDGATLMKVARYEEYFHGFVEHQARITHYAKQYPDRLPAVVVFVVPGQSRKETIAAALERWKGRHGSKGTFVRCFTTSEAVDVMGPMAHGSGFRAEVAAALAQNLAVPNVELQRTLSLLKHAATLFEQYQHEVNDSLHLVRERLQQATRLTSNAELLSMLRTPATPALLQEAADLAKELLQHLGPKAG